MKRGGEREERENEKRVEERGGQRWGMKEDRQTEREDEERDGKRGRG